MLARSFLPAAELGISEIEQDALVRTLHMLERAEIAWCGDTFVRFNGNGFSMATFGTKNECGTVACICGWAHLLSNGLAFPEVACDHASLSEHRMTKRLPQGARDLFAFIGWSGAMPSKVTVAQAAHALSNYLTIGEPRWAEALAA